MRIGYARDSMRGKQHLSENRFLTGDRTAERVADEGGLDPTGLDGRIRQRGLHDRVARSVGSDWSV